MIVSKDLGGGAVAAPLARIAIDRGDEVTVISEGLAPREFAKHGVPLFFQGTPNSLDFPYEYQQGVSFSYFSKIWLDKIKPDAVIVTLGSPILLEDRFALGANECKIPLILLEDCHGAHVRTNSKSQLVFTVDDYAARLAQTAHPQSKVAVVGHPGVLATEEISAIKDRYLTDLKTSSTRIYAFVGGDPGATDEQLALLAKCLQQTSGQWCLIPRFHPKWINANDPVSGRTYGEIWRELLEPIVDHLESDTVGDGRKLVASADVAVADYSTLLTTAVCCGKTAVFLQTPKVLASMRASTGLSVFPLVELGCAHLVTEPVDLSEFLLPPSDCLSALRPYDPQKAYEKMKSFLCKL